jgi:hypothetical protein
MVAAVIDDTRLARFVMNSILVQFVDEATAAGNAPAAPAVVLRSHQPKRRTADIACRDSAIWNPLITSAPRKHLTEMCSVVLSENQKKCVKHEWQTSSCENNSIRTIVRATIGLQSLMPSLERLASVSVRTSLQLFGCVSFELPIDA